MIELKEWDYNLIKRIEKANLTDYGVIEIRGNYYIEPDDLFVMIDDIEDQRDYAENRIKDLCEEIDKKEDEYIPTTDKHYIDKIKQLEDKVKEQAEKLEILTGMMNEDDYDKAFERGFEI